MDLRQLVDLLWLETLRHIGVCDEPLSVAPGRDPELGSHRPFWPSTRSKALDSPAPTPSSTAGPGTSSSGIEENSMSRSHGESSKRHEIVLERSPRHHPQQRLREWWRAALGQARDPGSIPSSGRMRGGRPVGAGSDRRASAACVMQSWATRLASTVRGGFGAARSGPVRVACREQRTDDEIEERVAREGFDTIDSCDPAASFAGSLTSAPRLSSETVAARALADSWAT